MLPAQPNKSLIDGIEVILALASSADRVRCTELARYLGLETTRVNRLLKTLAAVGIVTQEADRSYTPGPGMHVLSAMSLFGSGLLRRAVPILEPLSRFGMVVALGVVWRDQVAYLYHRPPGTPSAEAVGRAGLFPASRSSIGLALLAHQTQHDLNRLYADREIPGFARFSDLESRLAEIRTTGVATIAVDDGTSYAAAIAQPDREPYAAVALSGNATGSRDTAVRAAVRAAAEKISAVVGNTKNLEGKS